MNKIFLKNIIGLLEKLEQTQEEIIDQVAAVCAESIYNGGLLYFFGTGSIRGFALTLGVYLNRLFCLCRLHLVCVWYISALLVLMTVEHRIDWTQNKAFTVAVAVMGLILFLSMLWRARTNC